MSHRSNVCDLRTRRLNLINKVLPFKRIDPKHTIGVTLRVTVSNQRPLKTSTLLGGVLKPVAAHHKPTIVESLAKLDF